MIPLERHIAGLMPLAKNISPYRAVPDVKTFSIDDFIASLESGGPQLTSSVKVRAARPLRWCLETGTDHRSVIGPLEQFCIYNFVLWTWPSPVLQFYLSSSVKGDWEGLYRRFHRSPNFVSWYNQRHREMSQKLQLLHLESLSEAKIAIWDEADRVMLSFLQSLELHKMGEPGILLVWHKLQSDN